MAPPDPANDDGTILVVDAQAEWYVARLGTAVPEARLHPAASFDAADQALGATRAVITMGVPDAGGPLTAPLVAQMPRLEWVQCLLAGHEHIDRALADREDVLLTTARGIHGPQMAETVLLHMLALARRVKAIVDNQRARHWEPWPQPILAGRTVGVVGLGTSGRHIARTCKALGMTVLGISRSAEEADGVDEIHRREELRDVAAGVDFLVLVLEAGPDAHGLVGSEVLAAMRPDAYLINISRGSVLDERALLEAVRSGTIAGAGLDVFETEPLPPESPLWECENVFITPHLGGRADRLREQTLTVVEPNLRAFVAGRRQELVNLVTR